MNNKKVYLAQTGAILMAATVLGTNTCEARFGAGFGIYNGNGGSNNVEQVKRPTIQETAERLLNNEYFAPNKEIIPGNKDIVQSVKEQNSGSTSIYTLSKEGYVYRDGVKIEGFENIVKIAVGSASGAGGGNAHVIALKNDGTVWATGNNTTGQLGIGFEKSRELNQPVKYDPRYGYKRPCDICAPNAHGNGERFDYHSEQCGTVVYEVVQVKDITNAVDVAATYHSSAVLTGQGEVYTFGSNRNYELGSGEVSFDKYDYDTFCSYDPLKTNLGKITKIAGEEFSFVAENNSEARYGWAIIDNEPGSYQKYGKTPKMIEEGTGENKPWEDIIVSNKPSDPTEVPKDESNSTVVNPENQNEMEIVKSKANVSVKLRKPKKDAHLRLTIENEIKTLIDPDGFEMDLSFNKKQKAKVDYDIEESGKYEFIMIDHQEGNIQGCSKLIVDVNLKNKTVKTQIVELTEDELDEYVYAEEIEPVEDTKIEEDVKYNNKANTNVYDRSFKAETRDNKPKARLFRFLEI